MGLLHSSSNGGRRILLQRTQIQVRNLRDPEHPWTGYLVLTERGKENIFFFSTKKLRQADVIELEVIIGCKAETLTVSVQSCHDQVSSGRVMRVEAGAENPFPAKFYFRCYATIQKVVSAITDLNDKLDAAVSAPITETTAESIANAEAEKIAA